MPAKKTRKKPEVKAEDKEKIIEEIDIALSENTGVEEASEKEDSGQEPSVEERIQNLGEGEDSGQEESNVQEALDNEKDKQETNGISDLNLATQESDASADSIFSTPLAESEPPKKKGKNWSFIIIVICLCIISILAGFVGGYFYGKGADSSSEPAKSESAVEETPTPTPTEEAVDLASYSIEILNGSGVAGVAADEQQVLEADGFSVENTGNAPAQNLTQTTISVKKSVPKQYISKLKDSLSGDYVVSEDIGDLDEGNTYDVVVTLGSETVVDQ